MSLFRTNDNSDWDFTVLFLQPVYLGDVLILTDFKSSPIPFGISVPDGFKAIKEDGSYYKCPFDESFGALLVADCFDN